MVGDCGVGELGRMSPAWYRVDVDLQYDLCPPGKFILAIRFCGVSHPPSSPTCSALRSGIAGGMIWSQFDPHSSAGQ